MNNDKKEEISILNANEGVESLKGQNFDFLLDRNDDYKIKMVVSHNSELSNIVEQPLDRDVLLFSGTNSSGKSSKLNFYKYMLTPETSFTKIEKKINTDKDRATSFKFYFPYDNSFWVSEHENPEGTFCQILVKNEATDFEIKRLFVPLPYSEVRKWIFDDQEKSTGVDSKELTALVIKNDGVEIKDQKRLLKVMFLTDEKLSGRFNIVRLKNENDLDGYKFFFDVFSGGMGDENLLRKLFKKKVNTTLSRLKSSTSKSKDDSVNYKKMIDDLIAFKNKIDVLESKKKLSKQNERFKMILKERKGLGEVFFEAPLEVKKRDLIIKSKENSINKRQLKIKESEHKRGSSDKECAVLSSQKDNDKELNKKTNEDIALTAKKEIKQCEEAAKLKSDNENDNFNTKLKSLNKEVDSAKKSCKELSTLKQNGLKKTKESDVYNAKLRSENIQSSLKEKMENSISQDKEAVNLKAKITELKNSKILEINKIEKIQVSVERLKNSECSSVSKKMREMESSYSSEFQKLSDIYNEKLKESDKYSMTKLSVLTADIQTKKSLIENFDVKMSLAKKEIKNVSSILNIEEYKIEEKDDWLDSVKIQYKENMDIKNGECPIIPYEDLNKERKSLQLMKNEKSRLEKELSNIRNPLTLKGDDHKYYEMISLILNVSYTKQEYLNNKESFVNVLSCFEVVENEVFFAGKSFGFITISKPCREESLVLNEIEKIKAEISNQTKEEQLLLDSIKRSELLKKDFELNKKQAVLRVDALSSLINSVAFWDAIKMEEYNESKLKKIELEKKKIILENECESNKKRIKDDEFSQKTKLKEEKGVKEAEFLEIESFYNKLMREVEEEASLEKEACSSFYDEKIKDYQGSFEKVKENIVLRYEKEKKQETLKLNGEINKIDETFRNELKEEQSKCQEEINVLLSNKKEQEEKENLELTNVLKQINDEYLSQCSEKRALEKEALKKEQERFYTNQKEIDDKITKLNKLVLDLKDEIETNEVELISEKKTVKSLVKEIDSIKSLLTHQRFEDFSLRVSEKLKSVGSNTPIDYDYIELLKNAVDKEVSLNGEIKSIGKKFEEGGLLESAVCRDLEASGDLFKKAIINLKAVLEDAYSEDLETLKDALIAEFSDLKHLCVGYFEKIEGASEAIRITKNDVNDMFKGVVISNIKNFELEVNQNSAVKSFIKTMNGFKKEDFDRSSLDVKSVDRLIRVLEDGIGKIVKNSKNKIDKGEIDLDDLITSVKPLITKIDETKEVSGSNGTNTMFNILFAINSFKDLLEDCNFTMPIVIDEVAKLDGDNLVEALAQMKKNDFKLVCATPTLNMVSETPVSVTDINLSTCWTEKNDIIGRNKKTPKSTYFVSRRKDPDLSDAMKDSLQIGDDNTEGALNDCNEKV